jgi:hypothetical protein
MTYTQEDIDYYHTLIDKRDARIEQLELLVGEMPGHDELCYYCENRCNALAGDPSQWPIPLAHADEPGVPKWHHSGCVSGRLDEVAFWKKSFGDLDRKVQQEIYPEIEKIIERDVLIKDLVSTLLGPPLPIDKLDELLSRCRCHD